MALLSSQRRPAAELLVMALMLFSYSFKDLNDRLLGPVHKELHCAVSSMLQGY